MSVKNTIKWLLPIITAIILIPLVIGHKRNHFQRIPILKDARTQGLLIPRGNYYNVNRKSLISRQGGGAGGLASTLLAGPVFLAISSLLFSFPVLPMLFLAPMALSNFLPNMDDVADPSINDILQSVQNLGQGILDGIRPITGGSSSSSSSLSSPSSTLTSSSGSAASPPSASDSASGSGASSSSSSSSSPSSNTLSAIGSASEPIASIVPAPSSSSSSSSLPPKTIQPPSTDSLADLSTGFLSQLAAINEILSNPSNPSSDNSMASFPQLAANMLNSLSNFLLSSRREENNDKRQNKFKLPFAFRPSQQSLRTLSFMSRGIPEMDPILPYLRLLLTTSGKPRKVPQ